jgi:hypothetical protein
MLVWTNMRGVSAAGRRITAETDCAADRNAQYPHRQPGAQHVRVLDRCTDLRAAEAARFFPWIFNVAGTADLVAAITLATLYGAAPYMAAAYWIPAFWVPALLVTHYITFVVLWSRIRG